MTVVFMDRDGVINANRSDYVKSVDEFVVLPGALEGLARLRTAGVKVVVVSNQAAVGKGLLDAAELERISEKMRQTVSEGGGEIAGVYYCIHRKDESCDCRKPGTGMLCKASEEMGFPLEGSYFIGDAESDIIAGSKVGCTTIFVLTGRTPLEDMAHWKVKPNFVAPNLPAAVDFILDSENLRA